MRYVLYATYARCYTPCYAMLCPACDAELTSRWRRTKSADAESTRSRVRNQRRRRTKSFHACGPAATAQTAGGWLLAAGLWPVARCSAAGGGMLEEWVRCVLLQW